MISISDLFTKDINSNHVTIYPLVILGDTIFADHPSGGVERALRISTVKETIKELYTGDQSNWVDRVAPFYDYNLKISSIKESIDLKTHKYKISNVNITISQASDVVAYSQSLEGGENYDNLSDILPEFFNKKIRIYYKTQSCKTVDDCLLVYTGLVKKIRHDSKSIFLEAEDSTEYLIHQDVPIANIGYKDHVFNKQYVNKPIPMTYGDVAQAPVVPYIYKDSGSNYSSISIIPDDVSFITGSDRDIQINGFGTSENNPEEVYFSHIGNPDDNSALGQLNPLYIYKGDYFRVLQNYVDSVHVNESNIDIDFPTNTQYKIEETNQSLSITKEFIASYPQNPPAANEFMAMKVRYPNQCLLLKSKNILDGDPLSGITGIINVDVPQGILNPEAAIDNAFHTNLDYGSVEEFDTFAQVPNSFKLIVEEGEDLGFEEIHEFTPFKSSTKGWLHFNNATCGDVTDTSWGANWGDVGDINKVNYMFLMNSWCHTYMHKLPAVYIQLPPIDLIKKHVDEWLRANFGSNQGEDAIRYNTATSASIFDTTRGAEFNIQYCISPRFGSSWVSRCYNNASEPIYGDDNQNSVSSEEYFVYNNESDHPDYAFDYQNYNSSWVSNNPSGSYFRNYRYQARTAYRYDQSTNYQRHICNAFKPLSGRQTELNGASGPYEKMEFPTNLYKFSQAYNNGSNPEQITNVYVGLKLENSTMGGATQTWHVEDSGITPIGDKSIFINLWDLGDGKPYLYNSREQFCVVTPTHLKYKSRSGNNMKCKYGAEWNRVGINHWIDNDGVEQTYDQSTYDTDCLSNNGGHNYCAGAYGLDDCNIRDVRMKELVGCSTSPSNQGMFGGESWFVLFEQEHLNALHNMSDAAGEIGEDLGEWYDDGAETRISMNTLIPCNLKNYDGEHWGLDFNMDYGLDPNRTDVNLSVGEGGTFEERLSILFPLGDLVADDSYNVDTFVYGKVSMNIAAETGGVHDMSNTSDLSLECIATEVTDLDGVDFNAISPDGLHGCTLITISGSHANFNSTDMITMNWDAGSDVGSAFNSFWLSANGGEHNNRIDSWDQADKFNALSLVYRVTGTVASDYCKVSSEIYSLGIIQFLNFDKALDANMYADVYGRSSGNDIIDGSYKYTDTITDGNIPDLIEEPVDILYHFISKELKHDIIDREDWKVARQSGIGIKHAFSVKDLTDSKDIFNGIAIDSNILPVFDSNGTFTFKAIKKTYTDEDVIATINAKDVIKFAHSRTSPSEVKTLVNVKYRKDYETDEYTRETGWCDAYDFYGNGENGVGVYKTDLTIKDGYDYSKLGLKREDNIYTHNSDYIRDYDSAIKLRDFIMMYSCNQHTIISLELPLKYINLQSGDVVNISELINGLKAHGEDYTSDDVYRMAQKIYPYFIIASITKTSKAIKITLVQLHELTATFSPGIGSLSRKSELGVSVIDSEYVLSEAAALLGVTAEDIILYESYLIDEIQYMTTKQLIIGDIDGNASIDINDLNILNMLLNGQSFEGGNDIADGVTTTGVYGDANQDGNVNVADIVQIVAYILDDSDPADAEIVFEDINEDGTVNVVDIVTLVSIILGEG